MAKSASPNEKDGSSQRVWVGYILYGGDLCPSSAFPVAQPQGPGRGVRIGPRWEHSAWHWGASPARQLWPCAAEL